MVSEKKNTHSVMPQTPAQWKSVWKRIYPILGVVLIFATISLAYFYPAVFEGRQLFQQDVAGASGTAQDVRDYKEQTGETSYWTNSLFGGMPMYQIAPSYPSTQALQTTQDILTLRKPLDILPGEAWLIFAMLIGFYIFMRSLALRRLPSLIGAVMWTFSSYFIILIVAGHIWKLTALAFIPPTIAGLIWCYKGNYLKGAVVTAFFSALQIMANHIQMSYYFFFVMLFLMIGYLVEAIRNKTIPHFLKATAVVIVSGIIGIAINASGLYHTYEYSKETMRGGSELTLKQEDGSVPQSNHENKSGLDKEYITQWSYGIGETMTLLIPDFKGGASGYMGQDIKAMEKVNPIYVNPVSQMNHYWGDQPFTAGPVYVGAFVLFLFFLGCFIVKGPIKWAMIAATVFSILLAWGHNFMSLTSFFIDYMPLYNKFRTVSSILVIAEFSIPTLAILALVQFFKDPKPVLKNKTALGVSLGVTAGIALLFVLAPSLFTTLLSKQEQEMFRQVAGHPDVSGIMSALKSAREYILRTSALYSLGVIVAGCAVMYFYAIDKLKRVPALIILGVITLADLWVVDKNYLNDSHFIDNTQVQAQAHPVTDADKEITQDKDPHYRVLNLSVSTFNDATTSYKHRSIGGYHPAKLQRYQDLIEHQITKQNQQVLNMLDTRYYIAPQENGQISVLYNPQAFGPAWFVDDVAWVNNANEEMKSLNNVILNTTAVIDRRFETNEIKSASTPITTKDSATITLKEYKPNKAVYDIKGNTRSRVAVFSEIYYPHGWKAFVDGKPASIFRTDYILRGMVIPAGAHKVEMIFDPKSIHTTETLAFIAQIILLLAAIAAVGYPLYKRWRRNNPGSATR
ncbi:YfhO family protein [Porphyromonas pogonae]|uniref:YfhO family protein n=1 Tax=Porphyromonas pogonae TaxID=867595 RepID=UPI002E7A57E6|nr:YfhO family protein [Porphyromonas pogonae]